MLRRSARTYRVASPLVLSALAVSVGVLMTETVGLTRGPILFLLVAIVFSTYLVGRLGAAISVIAATAALPLFIVGRYSLDLTRLDAVVVTAVFVSTGIAVGLLSEHRNRATEAARETMHQLRGSLAEVSDLNDQLQHRKDLVEAIAANAASGLVFVDANDIPVFVNDAFTAMTGLTIEDMAGRPAHYSVHHSRPDGSPYPIEDCALDHANATCEGFRDVEETFVRKDGTFFPVVCSMTPLRRNDRITGSVFEIRDVTAQKEAQAMLEAALRAKDDFISHVSHELRSPITTIKGNAELLRDRWTDVPDDDRRLGLSDVASEAERLRRIVDSLLMLARLDRGITLDAEPTLTHRVATRVAANHQRRTGRDIQLRVLSRDAAMCSATYVEEVLENLVSNALKYSPPTAPVIIEVDAVQGSSIIRVLDGGPGVSDEDVRQLFTPFYRGAQTDGQVKGLGIGLAVCRRIAESHGGEIWVRRRAEGGSEFGVALPRASEVIAHAD